VENGRKSPPNGEIHRITIVNHQITIVKLRFTPLDTVLR